MMRESKIPDSIVRCIDDLELPDDVKAKTKEVYTWLDIGSTPRQNNRSKYICFCIHQAYVELDAMIVPHPCEIGKKVGLSHQQSKSSIQSRPPIKEGIKLKSSLKRPIDLMKKYALLRLHIKESTVDVMELVFNKIIKIDSSLLQEEKEPLVAAFIIAYCEANSIAIDKSFIAKEFYLEYNTIKTRQKRVENAMALL